MTAGKVIRGFCDEARDCSGCRRRHRVGWVLYLATSGYFNLTIDIESGDSEAAFASDPVRPVAGIDRTPRSEWDEAFGSMVHPRYGRPKMALPVRGDMTSDCALHCQHAHGTTKYGTWLASDQVPDKLARDPSHALRQISEIRRLRDSSILARRGNRVGSLQKPC